MTAVNLDAALITAGGDVELLSKLAQLVLDQLDIDLAAIRLHVAAKDTMALKDSAHRLKGSRGAISAAPVCEACTQLNNRARCAVTESYAAALVTLDMAVASALQSARYGRWGIS